MFPILHRQQTTVLCGSEVPSGGFFPIPRKKDHFRDQSSQMASGSREFVTVAYVVLPIIACG